MPPRKTASPSAAGAGSTTSGRKRRAQPVTATNQPDGGGGGGGGGGDGGNGGEPPAAMQEKVAGIIRNMAGLAGAAASISTAYASGDAGWPQHNGKGKMELTAVSRLMREMMANIQALNRELHPSADSVDSACVFGNLREYGDCEHDDPDTTCTYCTCKWDGGSYNAPPPDVLARFKAPPK